jgi:hypothetical protein
MHTLCDEDLDPQQEQAKQKIGAVESEHVKSALKCKVRINFNPVKAKKGLALPIASLNCAFCLLEKWSKGAIHTMMDLRSAGP